MTADSSDHVRAAAERYGVEPGDAAVEETEDALAEYDGLVLPTTPTTATEFGTVTDQEAFVRA